MIGDILLNVIAAAVGGGIVVAMRLARDRVDPQGQVGNDHWKAMWLALGLATVGLFIGVSVAVWALDRLVPYAIRLMASWLEGTGHSERDREAVTWTMGALQRETWLWSWPYVLVFLMIGLLAWGFNAALKNMEVGLPGRVADHVLIATAALAAATLGALIGLGAHWGFDEGSTWLFERSRQAVSEGSVDYYPRDTVITIGWTYLRSGVTIGLAALLIGGCVAALTRMVVRAR